MSQTNYPSIKTIMQVNRVDYDTAKLARFILVAKNRDVLESLKVYEQYYQETGKFMYNPHSLPELKLYMLNIVLGLYGIEAIQNNNDDWLEYLNTGDTYNATIIYYHGRFSVNSWGDIVEREYKLWEDR